MNFNRLNQSISRPKLYEKGTASMWTDAYISKQLLDLHLDSAVDVASRSSDKIKTITSKIAEQFSGKKLKILDLGCGPGLYTELFAKEGHEVTGIDFSPNSISYAKEQARKKKLPINYICDNYLEVDFEQEFDVIIMIYCDFGVLSLDERSLLIDKIHKSLKIDGLFIFDALNKKAIEKISFTRNFDVSEGGFWSGFPYISLSESFHYEENKAILDQHTIIQENGKQSVYRFWNHYFNIVDISNMFSSFRIYGELDIQLNDGVYNDNGVTFYKVTK